MLNPLCFFRTNCDDINDEIIIMAISITHSIILFSNIPLTAVAKIKIEFDISDIANTLFFILDVDIREVRNEIRKTAVPAKIS